jgi:hypothetical protein
MKIQKLLPILFCFSVVLLNANTLPLPNLTFDFGIEKVTSCQYQIRIRHFSNATISVAVNGQMIVNNSYSPPAANAFATITVVDGAVATINATNCIVYISNLSSGAYYVVDFNPIVNTQLRFLAGCMISDDL